MHLLNNSIHKEECCRTNSFKYLNLEATFKLLNRDHFMVNSKSISKGVSHKTQFNFHYPDFKVQILHLLCQEISQTLLYNSHNQADYQSKILRKKMNRLKN